MPFDMGVNMEEVTEEKQEQTPNEKLQYPLSERELEILQMLPRNRTAKMMGVALGISHRTVQFHMDNLYWKLGVSGMNAKDRAVRKGRELGLIK
jgi:LuxR family maltose regulon positive regulatory protein